MRKIRRAWLRLLVDIRQQRELEALYSTQSARRREAHVAILDGCR